LIGRARVLFTALIAAALCASCSGEAGPPPATAPAEARGDTNAEASHLDSPAAMAAKSESGAETASTTSPSAPPTAPPSPGDGRPRLYASQGFVKIMAAPDLKANLIGMVRAGQGVPLKTGKPLTGSSLGSCKSGWYETLPRGVACLNDLSTLDRDDVRVAAARLALPDTSRALPFNVGTSIGAPMYARIPTRKEQLQREPGLEAYLARPATASDPEDGAIDARPSNNPVPPELTRYFAAAKPRLLADDSAYAERKIAWSREFDAEGRTWLLTADMGLVPKDKVRQKATPQLQGVDLAAPGAPKLPLAFTWLGDVKRFKRDASGTLVDTGEVWPRHTYFEVTTQSTRGPGGMFWKTTDDHYVRNDQVSMIKVRDGGRPPSVKAKDKWIHVRVTWGYLVAYEGDKPVYTAAISPGVDGINARSQGHNTKQGIHTVGWKLFSADMSGVDKAKEWAVDEVPFVGYYKESYGLHGAYWHDEFGRPKSHGCINLAPKDAKWMFGWMDPAMPEGWYAVAAAPGMGVPFTWVDVRP